jgi:hypothetical protein
MGLRAEPELENFLAGLEQPMNKTCIMLNLICILKFHLDITLCHDHRQQAGCGLKQERVALEVGHDTITRRTSGYRTTSHHAYLSFQNLRQG